MRAVTKTDIINFLINPENISANQKASYNSEIKIVHLLHENFE